MMGPSHAACGAAAWVALTADYQLHLQDLTVPIGWGVLDVGDTGVLTGALVTAGAALLPDLDHPDGTVARSLRPLSTWLARGICRLSGGHRRGTHSVLGVAVFTGLAAAAQKIGIPVEGLGWVWPLAAVMSVLLIAFAVQVLAFVPDRSRSSTGSWGSGWASWWGCTRPPTSGGSPRPWPRGWSPTWPGTW